MACFGLYTSKRSSGAEPRGDGTPIPPGASGLAIEVICEGNEYAILFSTVDDPAAPTQLECRIGFANGSKACAVWRDRGFPLVDAAIEVHGSDLTVTAPSFSKGPALDYHARLLTIHGLDLRADSTSAAALPLDTAYSQPQYIPDFAYPATLLRRRQRTWRPKRRAVGRSAARPRFAVEALRLPSLAPFRSSNAEAVGAWTGRLELPDWPPPAPVSTQSIPRETIFGVPAFRFENVELLGFRIDLDCFGYGDNRLLESLTDRLNFHLLDRDPRMVSDFCYRPATGTILLELLRYDKMKLRDNVPPLTREDFQSQHELLVQMLVGRVDDDTAQARDLAVFVPAIFVDNPWSKVLGRGALGYDKRMADFCVFEGGAWKALRPDGRLKPGTEPEPLASVGRIDLSTNTGAPPSGLTLLEIDCPYEDEDWDNFVTIDLGLALGSSTSRAVKWRRTDFQAAAFRRLFAKSRFDKKLFGFRSIQVSPVGETRLLQEWDCETSWITSAFAINNPVEVAIPFGTVDLTLHCEPSAPEPWQTLCQLLGIYKGQHRTIGLATGNCYRMRCSMDLTIDNGLE